MTWLAFIIEKKSNGEYFVVLNRRPNGLITTIPCRGLLLFLCVSHTHAHTHTHTHTYTHTRARARAFFACIEHFWVIICGKNENLTNASIVWRCEIESCLCVSVCVDSVLHQAPSSVESCLTNEFVHCFGNGIFSCCPLGTHRCSGE